MRSIGRSEFRAYFQPSRILLGLFPHGESFNPIALCFAMSSSYHPPIYNIAVQQGSLSFELAQTAERVVLAVPGESMAQSVLASGLASGLDTDKVAELGFNVITFGNRGALGVGQAIANLDCNIVGRMVTGDHLTLACEVVEFVVDDDVEELPLLSVGPRGAGYRLLASHGLHRLAVVDTSEAADEEGGS